MRFILGKSYHFKSLVEFMGFFNGYSVTAECVEVGDGRAAFIGVYKGRSIHQVWLREWECNYIITELDNSIHGCPWL